LCPKVAGSFYTNLQEICSKHNNRGTHIWNIDEIGAQAGRQGIAHVLAKKRSKGVYSMILDENKWLFILAYVNAARQSIPSFYIFRGL
jgi:hypothetical protein